ncbi:hypothetical protein FS837_009803 [Tulasnella sp. UAMH 9824]|nr:hypothetical protein FS837_009803 [Tulasnella sp. UAMH 9824]
MDAIVDNNATAPRSSSKTATATSKPLSTFAKTPSAQRRGSQSGTSTDILDALNEQTPPPQTRQQHSRKTSISSNTSMSRVRSRANYEMDDELQLGNGQELEEPALKRVKGEPIDDDTAHSTYRSPSINVFNSHTSARQPSNEVIDVDSTDLEIPLESPNTVFRPNLQPQPSPHPQGQFSLIESINDDFERYLEQQQHKAESLRKKWLACSMEEWEQGGSDVCNKFGAIVERVRDGMQSKIRAFSAINSRMADHSKALDEQERSLQREKELLVKETGRVVAKPLWPFGVAAALTFYLVSGLQDAAVQSTTSNSSSSSLAKYPNSPLVRLCPESKSFPPVAPSPPQSASVGRIGLFDGCISRHGASSVLSNPELVEEDRVETLVTGTVEQVREVVKELEKVHPYEEVAYDVYGLGDI